MGRRRRGGYGELAMIAFVTLFLGLVAGVQPVEVLVGEGVRAVELRLDGELVGRLEGAPWRLDADFGLPLEPHLLEAVALDADGRETDRARQWINLPRPAAEAKVVIEDTATESTATESTGIDGGARRVARLTWESLTGREPERVAVSFDGVPLEASDLRRLVLPPHDPGGLHFLRVELGFAENVTTVVEAVLDGRFSDRVSTELTAIAVELGPGAREPTPASLDGAILGDGGPLRVMAVEKGPAEVVIVPELEARSRLAALGRTRSAVTLGRGLQSAAARDGGLRYSARLKKDQQVRFLWPSAERRSGGRYAFETFPLSDALDAWDGGVYWLLARMRPLPYDAESQRLADAVAVAGMGAAGRNRRRAVVLLTTPDTGDASQLAPAEARRYLEHLRVPLVVWSLGEAAAEPRWPGVAEISSLRHLERAVKDLSRRLERQRIVFVEGLHLPQTISLAPAVEGLSLAR